MQISLRPSTLRRVLVLSLTFVIYSGFLAEVWRHVWRLPDPHGLAVFFDLSEEANFPNWFSSSLLFACAALLALVAVASRQENRPYARHWWFLSLAFLYISLDEAVQIHEEAGRWFHFGGILYFGWVIPAALVVGILGMSYLRFLGHLPRGIRNRFILAGAIYVGGALGMEFPLGYWTSLHGDDNFVYGMIDLVEESMEMIGTSIFLYSLIEHLSSPSGVLTISIATAPAARPARHPTAQLAQSGAIGAEGPDAMRPAATPRASIEPGAHVAATSPSALQGSCGPR